MASKSKWTCCCLSQSFWPSVICLVSNISKLVLSWMLRKQMLTTGLPSVVTSSLANQGEPSPWRHCWHLLQEDLQSLCQPLSWWYLWYYCSATNYSTTCLKTVGWLQGSTVCSRANTAPIYIMTSKLCSTHQFAAIHVIPCHFICTLWRWIKSWWLKMSWIINSATLFSSDRLRFCKWYITDVPK